MANKDILDTRQTWLEAPCLSLFGVWLRQQRHGMNLSQKDFAFESRIPRSLIGDYERGRHHPGTTCGPKLATFLGITLDQLKAKVQESQDYWNEHGEEGVRKLIERQPKGKLPRHAIQEIFINGGTKAYSDLRECGESTSWVKVTLPQSYEKRIIAIAAVYNDEGTTISSLLGTAIVELMDSGKWSEYEKEQH